MIRCRPGQVVVAARAEGMGPPAAAAAAVVAVAVAVVVVGCAMGDEPAGRAVSAAAAALLE